MRFNGRSLFLLFCFLWFLIDLYTSQPIPQEWKDRIHQGNMLFSQQDPSNFEWMPIIGNGYLSTLVLSDTIYVAGVYNGQNNSAEQSHRAKIPATLSISFDSSQTTKIGSAIG